MCTWFLAGYLADHKKGADPVVMPRGF